MFIRPTLKTHRLGAYADANGDETINLEFPEDFAALSDEDLNALHDRAVDTFNGLYGDGSDLTDDDVNALSALTEGIESVQAERGVRQEAARERADRAAELAAKVRPADEDTSEEELSADTDEDDPAESEDADGEFSVDNDKDKKDDDEDDRTGTAGP